MSYKKLWEAMTDQDKTEMKELIEEKMLKDFIRAAEMREEGKLNSTGYKKLMKELMKQNPFYGFYLGGQL